MTKPSSAEKAAKTRAKNYAKASAKEKARIDKKRKKAAKDADRKKRLSEGLSNPEDKKFYYGVMSVYSKRFGFSKPTCRCCKSTDWKFLVLDHIKSRPKSHKGLSGVTMARKLARDRHPSGIQVLCHNCNIAKEIFGGNCPHKLSSSGQKKLKKVGLPLGKIFSK